MFARTGIPKWLAISPVIIARIKAISLASGKNPPNFILGGPMCCYRQGRDIQCGGNPKNCPSYLQRFRGK